MCANHVSHAHACRSCSTHALGSCSIHACHSCSRQAHMPFMFHTCMHAVHVQHMHACRSCSTHARMPFMFHTCKLWLSVMISLQKNTIFLLFVEDYFRYYNLFFVQNADLCFWSWSNSLSRAELTVRSARLDSVKVPVSIRKVYKKLSAIEVRNFLTSNWWDIKRSLIGL